MTRVIHYRLVKSNGVTVYLCNPSYIVKPSKSTYENKNVTCKNCKRILPEIDAYLERLALRCPVIV